MATLKCCQRTEHFITDLTQCFELWTLIWKLLLKMCSFWEKIHSFHPRSFTGTQELAMCSFLLFCQPYSPRNYSQVMPGLVEIPSSNVSLLPIQISIFFPPQCPFLWSSKAPLLVNKSMYRTTTNTIPSATGLEKQEESNFILIYGHWKCFPPPIISKYKEGTEWINRSNSALPFSSFTKLARCWMPLAWTSSISQKACMNSEKPRKFFQAFHTNTYTKYSNCLCYVNSYEWK